MHVCSITISSKISPVKLQADIYGITLSPYNQLGHIEKLYFDKHQKKSSQKTRPRE